MARNLALLPLATVGHVFFHIRTILAE